jgi:HPt (histidine-containing phosphotransfer) domain-containing protein
MDVEDALQRLGHDEELFRDIVLIYTEDSPGMMKTIHEAVDNAGAPALQRAAHSLKGLTATLSAREAASAAYRLEQMGATGNLHEAAGALAELDRRVAELDQAVAEYLQHHR